MDKYKPKNVFGQRNAQRRLRKWFNRRIDGGRKGKKLKHTDKKEKNSRKKNKWASKHQSHLYTFYEVLTIRTDIWISYMILIYRNLIKRDFINNFTLLTLVKAWLYGFSYILIFHNYVQEFSSTVHSLRTT